VVRSVGAEKSRPGAAGTGVSRQQEIDVFPARQSQAGRAIMTLGFFRLFRVGNPQTWSLLAGSVVPTVLFRVVSIDWTEEVKPAFELQRRPNAPTWFVLKWRRCRLAQLFRAPVASLRWCCKRPKNKPGFFRRENTTVNPPRGYSVAAPSVFSWVRCPANHPPISKTCRVPA